MSAGKADPVVVVGEADVRGMVEYLLSCERVWPVVGLASVVDGDELVLEPAGVRLRVGSGPEIFVLAGEQEQRGLRELLGVALCLPPGAARVWWPGMTLRSDSRDHPLVSRVDDEDAPEMLGELARQFDLSRPVVRREIRELEHLRALAEHELAEERTQNQHLKIERHKALQQAKAASARLTGVTQQLEQPTGRADRTQEEDGLNAGA